jgi:penicillin-binding protein 1C
MSDENKLPDLPESDNEPSIHDDETSEIEAISDEELARMAANLSADGSAEDSMRVDLDAALNAPYEEEYDQAGANVAAESRDPHEQPTLSIPDGTGELDPKKTLMGSGGLDPNPDFAPKLPTEAGFTVPHIVPFEHTLVHVPGETQDNLPKVDAPPMPAYQQVYHHPSQGNQQQTQYQQQNTQPSYQQGTGYQQQQGYMPPPPPNYAPPVVSQHGSALPPRRKPRRILGCSPGCFAIFAGVFVTFCGGLTLIVVLLTATLGARLEEELSAQVAGVEDYENFQSTFFYDRDGELLYEAFTEGRRTNVQYEDFPQDLINATIAIEDDTFFTNPGFEVQATMRAFLQYVGVSEGDSGGSTITQQLVRNVLFDFEYRSERSPQRKIEEILLAYLLSQRMSKQDVMSLYLNEIYYGNMAYGAAAAARTFFDKDLSELTIGESALLAGLPQAPANLDPFNPDPVVQEAVADRWRLVLDRMVAERMITTEDRNAALASGYSINPPDAPLRAPHFTVYAQSELEQLLIDLGYSPDAVARGGLQVFTTVDLGLQDLAETAARNQVSQLGGLTISNSAVIVMQPITGEILAMVGSIDYNNDDIDGRVNVTISPRQPGSAMKPLTYASALERGITLGDIIWDTETVISDYRPRNYDGTFHGPVRIRTALANSYNIPAVQTLREIGVESLLEIASRFGIESLGGDASRYGLSLTLGGGEVTLMELTRAYGVFGNGGVYVPTTSILCILDNDDNIIFQYENGCPRGNNTANTVNETGFGTRVLDPRVAYAITDILSDNAARTPAMGSNSPLNTGGLFTAVKTGTTDDFRDNWTVGYNRNVAVGVWVGNSDGTPMSSGTTGLTGAAPIWNAVINGIYNTGAIDEFIVDGGRLPDQLDVPTGMSQRRLCSINAMREPAIECNQSIDELWFDSPIGLPDGQGGLQYPPAPQPQADQPPASGPWLREVEPDIYRVVVNPIPTNLSGAIVIQLPGAQVQPPSPIYCQVPVELQASSPTARDQLFIAPPPNVEDAARAEHYARNNGFAFLPTIACNSDLISASGGANIVTAFITQPAPNQVVYANMPILGTANFTPEQALYYKLELFGGQFGENWVTLGETHGSPVVNNALEILPGLQPGSYILQLVVVGNDGNYVQPPYQVPFTSP